MQKKRIQPIAQLGNRTHARKKSQKKNKKKNKNPAHHKNL